MLGKRTTLLDKRTTTCCNLLMSGDILHTRVVLPTRHGGPYNSTGWTFKPDIIWPFGQSTRQVDLITQQGGLYNPTGCPLQPKSVALFVRRIKLANYFYLYCLYCHYWVFLIKKGKCQKKCFPAIKPLFLIV